VIFVKLEHKKYECFRQGLIKRVRRDFPDASFSVSVKVDSMEYILKIQFERKNRIYILQALRIDCDNSKKLITDNNLLLSLLNILIWQEISDI